jgi:hypothetical protein
MIKKLIKIVFCTFIFIGYIGAESIDADRQPYIESLKFINNSIAEMRDILTFLDNDKVYLATLKLRYYFYLKQIRRIDLQVKDRKTLRDLPNTPEKKRHEIKKQIMHLIATKKNLLQRCEVIVREIQKQVDLVNEQQKD